MADGNAGDLVIGRQRRRLTLCGATNRVDVQRHGEDPAVAHKTLRNDMLRAMPDGSCRSSEHGDLKAALLVQMNVQTGHRHVVVLVVEPHQPPGQFAGVWSYT